MSSSTFAYVYWPTGFLIWSLIKFFNPFSFRLPVFVAETCSSCNWPVSAAVISDKQIFNKLFMLT